jgi:hypothetical protein
MKVSASTEVSRMIARERKLAREQKLAADAERKLASERAYQAERAARLAEHATANPFGRADWRLAAREDRALGSSPATTPMRDLPVPRDGLGAVWGNSTHLDHYRYKRPADERSSKVDGRQWIIRLGRDGQAANAWHYMPAGRHPACDADATIGKNDTHHLNTAVRRDLADGRPLLDETASMVADCCWPFLISDAMLILERGAQP